MKIGLKKIRVIKIGDSTLRGKPITQETYEKPSGI